MDDQILEPPEDVIRGELLSITAININRAFRRLDILISDLRARVLQLESKAADHWPDIR